MGYHHRRTISTSDEETRMQSLTNRKEDSYDRARWYFAAVGCTCPQPLRRSTRIEPGAPPRRSRHQTETQWRGLHIMSPGREGLPLLKRAIAEKLAPMGVNVLIMEVNYDFVFQSHPELSGGDNALRVEDARDLAANLPQIRHSSDPHVELPGPPVVGTDHVCTVGQASRARRVARGARTTKGSTAGAGARFTPTSTRSSSP